MDVSNLQLRILYEIVIRLACLDLVAGVAVDGDDPQHVQWITSRAEERAKEYGIQGVTYRLTLGKLYWQLLIAVL